MDAHMDPSKYWLIKAYQRDEIIDTSRAPDFWLTRADEIEAFLRSLEGVEVFELGRSAGGRPILAAAWGAREDLPGRTSKSLSSALSGGNAEAFYGKGKRTRPSFVFLGAAHGTEMEGTVAALNFLNVVVTGKDLRGREWPRLGEAGRKMRIVLIPLFNIDGRERYNMCRHFIGVEGSGWIGQGRFKNGEQLKWPTSKLHFPLPVDELEIVGSYFNDHGVNLVYDTDFAGDRQPETRALVRFLREERPDCVLCSHSDNGSLVQPPDSFIPERHRLRQIQIGAIVSSRLQAKGAKKHGLNSLLDCYAGQVFYQTDMIYHCSGALPLLVEFPHGYQNLPDNFDEILDIGMTVLEEVIAFGAAYGFRPREATPAT